MKILKDIEKRFKGFEGNNRIMIPLSIEGHVHYLINVSSYYVSDVFVCSVYVIPEASKIGIRDLTKKRCGIREIAKYRDGIRDLTATR